MGGVLVSAENVPPSPAAVSVPVPPLVQRKPLGLSLLKLTMGAWVSVFVSMPGPAATRHWAEGCCRFLLPPQQPYLLPSAPRAPAPGAAQAC